MKNIYIRKAFKVNKQLEKGQEICDNCFPAPFFRFWSKLFPQIFIRGDRIVFSSFVSGGFEIFSDYQIHIGSYFWWTWIFVQWVLGPTVFQWIVARYAAARLEVVRGPNKTTPVCLARCDEQITNWWSVALKFARERPGSFYLMSMLVSICCDFNCDFSAGWLSS